MERERIEYVCDRCKIGVLLPPNPAGVALQPNGWLICQMHTLGASTFVRHLCPSCAKAFNVFLFGEVGGPQQLKLTLEVDKPTKPHGDWEANKLDGQDYG